MGRDMGVVEHRWLATAAQFGRQERSANEVELGITDHCQLLGAKACLRNQAIADFRSRNEHQIEHGAGLVEPDRAISCAVPRMDQSQIIEAIPRLEDRRRLFGNHKRAERAEEIEIVAIDRNLGGGDDPVERANHASEQQVPLLQLHQLQATAGTMEDDEAEDLGV